MPINVECPGCNAKLRAPDTAAGKKIKCPKCAGVIPVPAAETGMSAEPPEPEPLARAMPAPSRRSRDDDDDPPPRRRDRDDDDDDMPRRRIRRDAHETEPSTAVQLTTGIISLVCGIVAAIFSIIPCCGAVIAWPLGGIGLLVGVIGLAVGLFNQKRAIGFPIAGIIVSLLAIVIATVWWIVYGLAVTTAVTEAEKQAKIRDQKAQEFLDQQAKLAKEKKDTPKETVKDTGPDLRPQASVNYRNQTANNLKQLGMALQSYHDTYKKFPSPNTSSSKNKKGLSWRVAILPFIEQGPLFQQFRQNESWDSLHNKNLIANMPRVFKTAPEIDPADNEGKTYYQYVTGGGTPFPDPFAVVNFNRFSDGMSNTWLVVEARKSVIWTAPDDCPMVFPDGPALGGVYSNGYFVLTAAAIPHFVFNGTYDGPAIQSLVDPADGKIVNNWPPQ